MIDASYLFDGSISGSTLTGSAITVTRDSTNILDLLAARDIGADNELGLFVHVSQAFTAAGAATMTIDYQTCATVGGTYKSLLLSNSYGKADLIVGAPVFRYALPMNQALNSTSGVVAAPGRYVKLVYTVGTGPMTAGAVVAWIAPINDRVQYQTYAGNFTV